jgi:uncharacterized protein (TIGR03382 family)
VYRDTITPPLLGDNRTKLAINNAASLASGTQCRNLRAPFLFFAAENHIEFLCRASYLWQAETRSSTGNGDADFTGIPGERVRDFCGLLALVRPANGRPGRRHLRQPGRRGAVRPPRNLGNRETRCMSASLNILIPAVILVLWGLAVAAWLRRRRK